MNKCKSCGSTKIEIEDSIAIFFFESDDSEIQEDFRMYRCKNRKCNYTEVEHI